MAGGTPPDSLKNSKHSGNKYHEGGIKPGPIGSEFGEAEMQRVGRMRLGEARVVEGSRQRKLSVLTPGGRREPGVSKEWNVLLSRFLSSVSCCHRPTSDLATPSASY